MNLAGPPWASTQADVFRRLRVGRHCGGLDANPSARGILGRRGALIPLRGRSVAVASSASAASPSPPRTGWFTKLFFESALEDSLKAEYRRLHTTGGVFDYAAWHNHRSSSRYISSFITWPRSKALHGITSPVLFIMAVALLVVLANALAVWGVMPFKLFHPSFPSLPWSVASSFLSLLLVFRNNSAYTRFLEGRAAFDRVARACRDLARQGTSWLPETRPALRQQFLRHVLAFPRSLKFHLREGETLETSKWLSEAEERRCGEALNKPTYLLAMLTACVQSAGLQPTIQGAFDANIVELQKAVNTCDTILNEPIPVIWSKFTNRFLVLFLTTLPLPLYESCHLAMLPVVAFLSIVMLGIADIGTQLEEPFSVIDLNGLVDGCEDGCEETISLGFAAAANVDQRVGKSEDPSAIMNAL